MRKTTALALLALSLSGCSVMLAGPKRVVRQAADPAAAWARVLRDRVDDKGRVDLDGLRKSPDDLDEFVSYVATFGPATDPTMFPAPESRLAYLINAYNALAIYDAVAGNLPKDKITFFFRAKAMLGGRLVSLNAIEKDELRPLGDPRVHFALHLMARGGPRLRREPFAAAAISDQLEAAAREFLNDPRNVKIDDAERKIWLSPILKWCEKDFKKKAPSLKAYVDRYRPQPLPEAYRVGYLPFDWTINAQ